MTRLNELYSIVRLLAALALFAVVFGAIVYALARSNRRIDRAERSKTLRRLRRLAPKDRPTGQIVDVEA